MVVNTCVFHFESSYNTELRHQDVGVLALKTGFFVCFVLLVPGMLQFSIMTHLNTPCHVFQTIMVCEN